MSRLLLETARLRLRPFRRDDLEAAFQRLDTDYPNLASQGVMRRLGVRLERNPQSEPPWLQMVGVLDHTDWPA